MATWLIITHIWKYILMGNTTYSGTNRCFIIDHLSTTSDMFQGINFTFGCVTIDPDSSAYDPRPLKPYLAKLGVPYFYEEQSKLLHSLVCWPNKTIMFFNCWLCLRNLSIQLINLWWPASLKKSIWKTNISGSNYANPKWFWMLRSPHSSLSNW